MSAFQFHVWCTFDFGRRPWRCRLFAPSLLTPREGSWNHEILNETHFYQKWWWHLHRQDMYTYYVWHNHSIQLGGQFHLESDCPVRVHGGLQELASTQVPKQHQTCENFWYNRDSSQLLLPMPVPMVRMFPLKETLRMPHPELREGIFLTDCNFNFKSNLSMPQRIDMFQWCAIRTWFNES